MVKKNILLIILITAFFLVTASFASAVRICPDDDIYRCPDPEPTCLEYGDRYCSSINCCGGNHLACSATTPKTCICADGYEWQALESKCVSVTATCAALNGKPSLTSEKRCCNWAEGGNYNVLINSADTCLKASCALLNEHPSGTSTGTCCAIGARDNVFDLENSGDVCTKVLCLDYLESGCPTTFCCGGYNLACSGGTCRCQAGCSWDGFRCDCGGGLPICALENEKFSATTQNRCCNVGERGNTKILEKVGEYCRATCAVKRNYYPDTDSDGYGRTSGLVQACSAPAGYTLISGDCDDTNRYVHPGATEVCVGAVDEDCDGLRDCADPDCAASKSCIACTNDVDCPEAPGGCYTPRCVAGSCTITNINCANDNYCCYPYCNPITTDADCDAGCSAVPLGQSATMTFRPVPTGGVGVLWAYGDQDTVRGIGTRTTSKSFEATIMNKLSGKLQCDYPHVMRSFAIMDTECIKDDANITSALFKFDIQGRSGSPPTSIWIDQSSLGDSSNDWIINPASTQMTDAVMIGSNPNLFPSGINSFSVNPALLKRGENNRFVLKMGDSTLSDFRIATNFDNCEWSPLTCGDGTRCDCRLNDQTPFGAIGSTPCGTDDPCYYGGNLAFECYANPPWNSCGDGASHPAWGLLAISDNNYNCWKGDWLEGIITGETPALEITFCNPFYFGDCDNSNGCTGAVARATAPYNSCDILSWADTTCGTETNCTDGIDNDCDGLIDASDSDCMQDESILIGNCDDGIDNEGDDGCDYDNSTVCAGDPNPATPPHGDDGCPVRIDGVGVNNSNPCQGQNLMVNCTASVSGVNSVIATLNNALCEFTGVWSGNVAMFRCPVIGGGVQEVRCSVNTRKSFQEGEDQVMNVTVGGCPFCPILEICDNGVDDDCDGLIDAGDANECPEGSGNETTSIYRQCGDGVNNDPWHDLPDVLTDMDDDGCCDLCNSAGYVFDATKSALSAIPGVGCGNILMSSTTGWEPGTEPYCCGDDAAKEFLNSTLKNSNPNDDVASAACPDCPRYACCNDSSHCVDATGKCQVGVEETFDLCLDNIDNDCDGLIDGADTSCGGNVAGFVFNDMGFRVPGAVVKSSPPGMASSLENSTITDATGHYELRSIVGNYTFIARKEGYDDNTTLVTVLPEGSGVVEVNFTLRNGSCHADCTDYYGNCNPACEGLSFVNSSGQLETCNFINPLCYDRPKNFGATHKNPDTNITTEYTCCKGPERTYKTLKVTVTGNMKDLYDYVLNVKFMGKQAKLHILTWNSEE